MFEPFYQYKGAIVKFIENEKQVLEDAFTFRHMHKMFKLTEEGKAAKGASETL